MIFIITGRPQSGKDTFINEIMKLNKGCVVNYSTVEPIKVFLRQLGWNNKKDKTIRSTIANIKNELKINDLLFKYNCQRIEEEISSFNEYDIWGHNYIIFIQCREPEEIKKFKNYFDAKIILIKSIRSEEVSNSNDQICEDIVPDYIIENNSTLEIYTKKIKKFFYEIKKRPYKI